MIHWFYQLTHSGEKMKKIMFMIMFLFGVFGTGLAYSELVAKDSNTDKAIGVILTKSQESFSKVIDATIEGLKQAKDLAKTELPLIGEEFLKMSAAKDIIWISFEILSIGIATAIFFLIKKYRFKEVTIQWIETRNGEGGDVGLFCARWFVLVITCWVSLYNLLVDVQDLVSIYFAPKIYIITHLVQLIRFGKI